jgi:hypothetical protein
MALPDPEWPTLTGCQDPLYLLADPGDTTEADKAIEFAQRIRCPLMPWQQALLRGMLATKPDGTFRHPTSCCIAPRQSGKTLVAADIWILYALFVANHGDGMRVLYSSQRWKTSENTYLRVLRLIDSRPSLSRRVTRRLCSAGQAAIWLSSGARVEFVTRSMDSGRGLDKIDGLLLDEGANIRGADLAALAPTQLASKNPATVYLSTAVNELIHPYGVVLTGLRQRALEAIGAGRTGTGLFYAEFAAPEPPAGCDEHERRRLRESPETARLASPSFGVIQTAEKLQTLRNQLSAVDYEVECLGWGRWSELGDGARRVVDPDAWNGLVDQCAVLAGSTPSVIAVDLSPVSKVWSICGAVRTEDGDRIAVELGWTGKASVNEVVGRVLDVVAAEDCDPYVLITAGSPAAVLKGFLEAGGVEADMINTADAANAAAAFLDGITAGRISHTGQIPLTDSVLAATRRDLTGGRFVFDAPAGGAPACHTVAAALAHWKAAQTAPPQPRRSLPPLAAVSDDGPSIMTRPF